MANVETWQGLYAVRDVPVPGLDAGAGLGGGGYNNYSSYNYTHMNVYKSATMRAVPGNTADDASSAHRQVGRGPVLGVVLGVSTVMGGCARACCCYEVYYL